MHDTLPYNRLLERVVPPGEDALAVAICAALRATSAKREDLRALSTFFARYLDGGELTGANLPLGGADDTTGLSWPTASMVWSDSEVLLHRDLEGALGAAFLAMIGRQCVALLEQGLEPGALAGLDRLRRCGVAVIALLGQHHAERLARWRSPRAVASDRWLLTLDRLPTSLRLKVASDQTQRARWAELLGGEAPAPEALRGAAGAGLMVDTAVLPAPLAARLREVAERNGEPDGTVVVADNAHGLRWLEAQGLEADMVFTDPPYNTGSREFVYRDRFKRPLWLSMMRERFEGMASLLDASGCCFVAIGDAAAADLRLVLEEVMGSEQFVADIIWEGRRSVSNDALISISHHHILLFARDRAAFEARKRDFRLPLTPKGYSNPDKDPRGAWKLDPFDAPNLRPNLTYPILNPSSGQVHMPPKGRCWRVNPVTCAQLMDDGRIMFGRRGTARPMLKRFLTDAKARGATPTTLWSDLPTTTSGTRLLQAMFGAKGLFSRPKPPELVMRAIELGLPAGGLVLDGFAGSGTTGHAAIALSREDGQPRRYVLLEQADYAHTLLVDRLQKAVRASKWKGGQPTRGDGVSHCIRVVELGS